MKKGFTLVELLVAISIIAALVGILLPNFMGARQRASESRSKQDLNAIKNALRLYYNDNQSYPRLGEPPPTDSWVNDLSTELQQYLPGIVNIGFTYSYQQSDNGNGFLLKSSLPGALELENGNSQIVCGIGIGSTDVDVFMLCSI